MIADLADDRITAHRANAMCNAGGKILKTVELEMRYGVEVPGKGRRLLRMSFDTELESREDPPMLRSGT